MNPFSRRGGGASGRRRVSFQLGLAHGCRRLRGGDGGGSGEAQAALRAPLESPPAGWELGQS